MIYILIYLTVINIIAFANYGIDKKKAENGEWRIPEKTLILYALAGGSLGALLGMRVFHHKTKKMKFVLVIPTILMIQIVAIVVIYQRWVLL